MTPTFLINCFSSGGVGVQCGVVQSVALPYPLCHNPQVGHSLLKHPSFSYYGRYFKYEQLCSLQILKYWDEY